MRISRHRFYLPAQRFNVFSAVFYRNRCTSTFRDFERPGPKLGPAPESARKDPRAAEKSVHMSKKKHVPGTQFVHSNFSSAIAFTFQLNIYSTLNSKQCVRKYGTAVFEGEGVKAKPQAVETGAFLPPSCA